LPFLPPEDVRVGFSLIKIETPKTMSSLLGYIERNYIGNEEKSARFPIEFWNVYARVLKVKE